MSLKNRFSLTLLAVATLIGRATLIAREQLARRGRKRQGLAERAALREECRRLHEENRLLRLRLLSIPGTKRPRYRPWQRFRILLHRARYGLSLRQTARAFALSPATVRRWLKDMRQACPRLAAPRRPIRRLDDLVAEVAHLLKREQIDWGTRRIAMILTRLGLSCSRSTIQRILRKPPPRKRDGRRGKAGTASKRGPLTARYPNHVWLADLTEIHLLGIPLLHVGAAIDMYSRKVVAIGLWRRPPTASKMARLLRKGAKRYGKPRHLVTDHGRQFTAKAFKRHLKQNGIRRRYGAVRSSQSVAVIERFWRTFKAERGTALWVFLPERILRRRAEAYVDWYNRYRPHWGLGAATPDEMFFRKRRNPPKPPENPTLHVSQLDGDDSLPVYRLKKAG